MKLSHMIAATAAAALMSGAAMAQDQSTSATQPMPESSTSMTPMQPMTPPAATSTDSMTTNSTTVSPDTGVTTATSATSYGTGASVTTSTVTNGPVPDTAENRAKYGSPMSNAGKRTKAVGN